MHRKIAPILILLALSTSLRAEESTSEMHPEPIDTNAIYNPPARPPAAHSLGIFISADFLWWKAVEDDMQFTTTIKEESHNCCSCTKIAKNTFLQSFKGTVEDPKYKWSPAFRIGLGYNLPHDGWDIAFLWTRYYTNNSLKKCAYPCDTLISSICCPSICITCCKDPCCCAKATNCSICCKNPCICSQATGIICSKTNPCNDCPQCCREKDCDCCCEPCCPCVNVCFDTVCPHQTLPLLCPYSTPDNYHPTTVAVENWKLRFNMLDGEIGRQYYTSKYFTLRPFFGVRGIWVSQTYNTNYQGPVNMVTNNMFTQGVTTAELEGCQTCCTEFTHRFEGTGPLFGFNAEWILGLGFSFYVDSALSLLWGKYDLEADSSLALTGILNRFNTTTSQFVETPFTDCAKYELNDDFHSGKAMTDLSLGLKWQGNFLDDAIALSIKVGYDIHTLINHNQLIQFNDQTDPNAVTPITPLFPNNPPPDLTWNRQLTLDARRGGDLTLQGLTVSMQLDF